MVGYVDTNNNPDKIDYIIPGNDDSMRAVEIYVRCVADAILDAQGANSASEAEFVEEQAPPTPTVRKKSSAKSASSKEWLKQKKGLSPFFLSIISEFLVRRHQNDD